ncbi:MAG: insulinase family protein [Myxococcales bacterium]|nr:insulinase family protein [Myxococcales bacterium]
MYTPRRQASPYLLIAMATAGLFACAHVPPQQTPAAPDEAPTGLPAQALPPLPLDPAVDKGTLANGLTYYVRENARPDKRAALRLVVNAGSVLEDDDQRGLAHLIEHMAFNGTRLFEKQEIVNTLEKAGVKFGQHTNAYTGFDETVYMLEVPTDDPALLEQGLLILQQFASAVTFDPVELDKERGVVVEEWRMGRGAETRVMDQQLPVLFKGSRYANRLPIGDKKVLETASLATVKRFYEDWYRPELMSVVAVGDFDGAKVKALIEKLFTPLTNPNPPRPRPSFPVPAHDEPRVSVVTDKELAQSTLSVVHTMPARGKATREDYRRMVLESLFHDMMNARLAELTKTAEPPFLAAFSGTERLVRASDVFVQMAIVDPAKSTEALAALARETERVDKHGFTPTELSRAQASLLRALQSLTEEKTKTLSSRLADEMVRNALTGEAMPGIEAELALHEEILPTVTLDELNRMARAGATRNRVLLLSAPAGTALPEAATLLTTFAAVEHEPLAPFVDRVAQGPLLPHAPLPGRIVDEASIGELDVTAWTLSNGARVLWKKTMFKNDEVLFTALSPGGHSRVNDVDYSTALYADGVVEQGGLGTFGPVELEKALAGKIVSVGPYIGELEEGLSGRSAPRDLLSLFELIHLSFTAPRVDADAFAAWKTQQRTALAHRSADPGAAFADALTELLHGRHPRRRPPSLERLERVDMERALALYRERFSDASGFTFVFVGNLDEATLRPWVEAYLASLPATPLPRRTSAKPKETWKDVGAKLATGRHELEVRRGVEPKAEVELLFTGKMPWSREAELDLAALASALGIKLREVVREELSGTYSINVSHNLSRRPRQEYQIGISFTCAPDRVEALTQVVRSELEAVRVHGLSEDYVTKVKMAARRQHELNLQQNGFWLRVLADAARFDDDPRIVLSAPLRIETLSTSRLQAMAKKVFDTRHHMRAVLRPEGSRSTAGAENRGKAAPRSGALEKEHVLTTR